MQPLSLFELNNLVRSAIAATFEDKVYWMAAELSEVRQSAGGHCYVEFVEKQEYTNALVAKARGNIWRNVYTSLAKHFERATGQRLQAGMKVLVAVRPELHELYGYALTVVDIDPTYTLGDLARRRKEIIERLKAEGVFSMNKELCLPRPLRRVAIISSPTAAGYGDFCDQMAQSGFPFELQLFPAVMQGERVEQSIIAALDDIAARADCWDAVVIIRGGGAVSDLNGFDTYLLAANVAQFPLPVLTGIGHERDDTVIDLVAHTRLKTPTAVAAFLIQQRIDEIKLLEDLRALLQGVCTSYLERQQTLIMRLSYRWERSATTFTTLQRESLLRYHRRLEQTIEKFLHDRQNRLTPMLQCLEHAAKMRLMRCEQQLIVCQKAVELASPERLLKMGYSITLCNGKVVKDSSALKSGDRITTRVAQGEIVSIVE